MNISLFSQRQRIPILIHGMYWCTIGIQNMSLFSKYSLNSSLNISTINDCIILRIRTLIYTPNYTSFLPQTPDILFSSSTDNEKLTWQWESDGQPNVICCISCFFNKISRFRDISISDQSYHTWRKHWHAIGLFSSVRVGYRWGSSYREKYFSFLLWRYTVFVEEWNRWKFIFSVLMSII